VLELEVSSLRSLLQAAEERASYAGAVEAELESTRTRVADLSDSTDIVPLEKLTSELSSPKLLLKEMEMGFTIVLDLDQTLITVVNGNVEGGSTYRISYPGKAKEWIMLRPFTVDVLQKVSTMISNWSIVFMF
jgi:hypothetical protein